MQVKARKVDERDERALLQADHEPVGLTKRGDLAALDLGLDAETEHPGAASFEALVNAVAACLPPSGRADPLALATELWASLHGIVDLRNHQTRTALARTHRACRRGTGRREHGHSFRPLATGARHAYPRLRHAERQRVCLRRGIRVLRLRPPCAASSPEGSRYSPSICTLKSTAALLTKLLSAGQDHDE